MKQPSFHFTLPLATSLLMLLALSAGARPHLQPQKPTLAEQQVQVEGIIGGVVDKLWRQTDSYWHKGEYPRIIALDRIVAEADPQFLEAYSKGSWLMDSLGRREDAEAFYTLGIRRNLRAAYAFWNLEFFYFNTQRDYPAAVRVFQKDTRQVDASLKDWKMLTYVQEKAGDWEATVATWRTIKAHWPNGMSVDRLLAEAEEKRRQAQLEGKPSQ